MDFDLKNDGNLIEAKDIFRNIRVAEDADEGITGYEYYYIQDQDRPDVLATKLYGDATLYWLFWMVNPHLAVHNDWPKSQRVLEKFIKREGIQFWSLIVLVNLHKLHSIFFMNEHF